MFTFYCFGWHVLFHLSPILILPLKRQVLNSTLPPAHLSFTVYLPPPFCSQTSAEIAMLHSQVCLCLPKRVFESLHYLYYPVYILWCFWDFSMLICFNYSITFYLNKSVYSSSLLREGQDGSTFSLCSKHVCACLLRKRCWRLSKASI